MLANLATEAMLRLISTPAFADSPSEMLKKSTTLLSNGVAFLGGVLIVFGLVNLGMTIKDGMQGGGGQLSGAIAMIVGGAIVVAASVYFGTLATDWAV